MTGMKCLWRCVKPPRNSKISKKISKLGSYSYIKNDLVCVAKSRWRCEPSFRYLELRNSLSLQLSTGNGRNFMYIRFGCYISLYVLYNLQKWVCNYCSVNFEFNSACSWRKHDAWLNWVKKYTSSLISIFNWNCLWKAWNEPKLYT